MLETYIEKVSDKQDLSEEEAYTCLDVVFSQEVPKTDLISFLGALSDKGECVDEVVGFARACRERMVTVHLSKPAMDLCGTGGSNQDRFNVSTAVTFVLAALDVPVAKHGNRGSRKSNGSFDFLEALEIPIYSDPKEVASFFGIYGFCFMFAPVHHPAMKKVKDVRREIGRRTIFNLIGPLCNPAGVDHQVIGATTESVGQLLASSLQRLGTKRSMVVVGGDGRDEMSVTHTSVLFDVVPNSIDRLVFDPHVYELGVSYEDFVGFGGLSSDNAVLFEEIFFNCDDQHPIAQCVALNAALCLVVYGVTPTIQEGYDLAIGTIRSQLAWQAYYQIVSKIDRSSV